MTLEHSQAIRSRRTKGQFWRKLELANSLRSIARDYGMHHVALIRALSGANTTRRFSDGDFKDIRHRRRLCRHAGYQHRKNSDKQLKADYRMSTDTLYKITDRAPEPGASNPINKFLTMRL